MSFLKPKSFKDLLIHLGVMVSIIIIGILMIFYLWLPIATNHGETITIPDVKGKLPDELETFLNARELRYEVIPDSTYSPDEKPLAVLRQVPPPNAKVKENRKIYVTLNARNPPMVRMPRVEDLSLKSALMTLKSYDLTFGKPKYVPDQFFVVHEAQINGRTIFEGEKIEKGSTVDLVIGDGYGNAVFQSPLLLGLELEEAETVILGSGLKIGRINYTNKSKTVFTEKGVSFYRNIAPLSIQKQYPSAGEVLEIGDIVDLWVYHPDTVATSGSSTILDN